MIIVSLTTIPNRIKYLQPVVDSILDQTVKPDVIKLYIPKEYKKRSLGMIDMDELPKGCEVVYLDEDDGPATKILPALKEYQGKDVSIVYCDDDKIYNKNWIKRLTDKSKENPHDCIIEEGSHLGWNMFKFWEGNHMFKYRFLRIVSLGFWHPKNKLPKKNSKYYDIAEGHGGVLVKPYFFPSEVFDIPDIMWSVDDIWLSGMMTVHGTKIQRTVKTKAEKSVPINIKKDQPLNLYSYKGYDRGAADCLCAKYFIDNYGIWEQYKDLCYKVFIPHY